MHKLEHRFTPLSELLEGISPALDQLIIRSLHPDPAVRPDSIAEFLRGMRSEEQPKTLLMPKPVSKVPASPLKKQWNKPLAQSAQVQAPEATASKEERRRRMRHSVQIPSTLSDSNAKGQGSWPAQIMDLSSEGLRLQIHTPFEPGTLLIGGLAAAAHHPTELRAVDVAYGHELLDQPPLLLAGNHADSVGSGQLAQLGGKHP